MKRLGVLPLGIIGTTMGEFGSGFPVFPAINSHIPTWAQWCIGSLTLVISVSWVRVLAQMVGVRDGALDWTFWGLFKSRFMMPIQRESYLVSMERTAADQSGSGVREQTEEATVASTAES